MVDTAEKTAFEARLLTVGAQARTAANTLRLASADARKAAILAMAVRVRECAQHYRKRQQKRYERGKRQRPIARHARPLKTGRGPHRGGCREP